MDYDALISLFLFAILLIVALLDLNIFFNLYTVRRLSKYITRNGTRIMIGFISLFAIYHNIIIIL